MSKFSLNQFIKEFQPVKVQLKYFDLSQPNIATAYADLSFLMDSKNETNTISTYFEAVYLGIEHRPRSYSTIKLNVSAISSPDSATVRQAISTYLHEVQLNVLQDLFSQEMLSDDEITAIELMYPKALNYQADVHDIKHLPFKTVETLPTAEPGLGFASEVLYAFTDKIVAEALYDIVLNYFNPNAKFDDFIEHASELITQKQQKP